MNIGKVKILQRNKVRDITLLPGDTLSVRYTDPYKKTETLAETKIEKMCVINEVSIFENDLYIGAALHKKT